MDDQIIYYSFWVWVLFPQKQPVNCSYLELKVEQGLEYYDVPFPCFENRMACNDGQIQVDLTLFVVAVNSYRSKYYAYLKSEKTPGGQIKEGLRIREEGCDWVYECNHEHKHSLDHYCSYLFSALCHHWCLDLKWLGWIIPDPVFKALPFVEVLDLIQVTIKFNVCANCWVSQFIFVWSKRAFLL